MRITIRCEGHVMRVIAILHLRANLHEAPSRLGLLIGGVLAGDDGRWTIDEGSGIRDQVYATRNTRYTPYRLSSIIHRPTPYRSRAGALPKTGRGPCPGAAQRTAFTSTRRTSG